MLKKSFSNIYEIINIFQKNNNFNFIFIIILAIFSVILEIFGISLIYLFITNIFNDDKNEIINFIFERFKLSNKEFLFFGLISAIISNLLIILNSYIIESYKKGFEIFFSKNILLNFINNNFAYFYNKEFQIKTTQLLTHDLYVTSATLINSFLNIISRGFIIFSLVIFSMIFFNIQIFVSLSIVSLSTLIFYLFFLKKLRYHGNNAFNKTKFLFGSIKDLISNSKIINLFSKKNNIENYLFNISSIISKGRFTNNMFSISLKYFIEIIILSFFIIYVLINDFEDITDVFAILIISLRLLPHFTNINISIGYLNSNFLFGDNFLKFLKMHGELLEKSYVKENHETSLLQIKNIEYQINSLTFSNTKKLVFNKKINLSVGNKYLIKGSNGSGKSTLLNIFSINTLFDGSITINGKYKLNMNSVLEINEFRKINITFVPQEDLFFYGSSYENIKCFSNNIDKEIYNLFDTFNFKDKLEKNYNELSGGNQKILSILRAVNFKRSIFIFDEPFNNLDTHNSEKLLKFMNSNYFDDKILILTNHNQDLDENESFFKINI